LRLTTLNERVYDDDDDDDKVLAGAQTCAQPLLKAVVTLDPTIFKLEFDLDGLKMYLH